MSLSSEQSVKTTGFELMSLRHTPEVKAKLEQIAQIENSHFAVTARNAINDGLQAKYGIKIVGNQIVDHGNTPELPDSSITR